jgi:hypothetical protein
MAQRPGFDMDRLTTADKILGGAALLFFIDTFLAWQKACAGDVLTGLDIDVCVTRNAWGGDGGFAGVLAGLAAILLVAWIVVKALGMAPEINVPATTITLGLTGATILFGLIKFLIVVGEFAAYGAWIGLVLLLVLAYGGYMKWQESKTVMPPATTPPPPAGPPPVG